MFLTFKIAFFSFFFFFLYLEINDAEHTCNSFRQFTPNNDRENGTPYSRDISRKRRVACEARGQNTQENG